MPTGRIRPRRCCGNQQVKPLGGGFITQAFVELGVERFRKARRRNWKNKAQRIAALAAQLAGSPVGNITHLAGGLLHPAAGLRGDIRVAIQGARNGGDGQIELSGNITDGDGH